jgi:hypothetical protein
MVLTACRYPDEIEKSGLAELKERCPGPGYFFPDICVGSANRTTPQASRACSIRASFGADVGRLSCFRSQKPDRALVDSQRAGRLQKGAAGFLEVEGPPNPQVFQSVIAGSLASGGH